jgi:hypothetical protein
MAMRSHPLALVAARCMLLILSRASLSGVDKKTRRGVRPCYQPSERSGLTSHLAELDAELRPL